jgi:hypothetical protein
VAKPSAKDRAPGKPIIGRDTGVNGGTWPNGPSLTRPVAEAR